MPDYWFYREVYLGEEIPEADFDDAIQRAKEKIQEWERLYGTIKLRPGIDNALKCAICAVAEAIYDFMQEDINRAGGPLGKRTQSMREALYRREAQYYIYFGF